MAPAKTGIGVYDKHGREIRVGDIVLCHIWDSDDNLYWKFKYYVWDLSNLVYLGGGLDFGAAVGKRDSLDAVLEDMKESEPGLDKFEIIGGLF